MISNGALPDSLLNNAKGSGGTRQERLQGSEAIFSPTERELFAAALRRGLARVHPSSVVRPFASQRVPWYIGTTMHTKKYQKQFVVERVQTGVRIEKRLLKVLKALAEFHDLTLGDLLEGIVLHAFDGKTAFQKPSRQRIKDLKKFYGLDLDFRASHRLIESRALAHKLKTKMSRRVRRTKRTTPRKKKGGSK